MPNRRPASYVTLAIFNFIIGALSLFCGLSGFIRMTVTVNNRDVTPEFHAFMAREVPAYHTYRQIGGVVDLAVGFGMIAGGVMLLSAPPLGRIFALIVGIVSLLEQVAVVLLQLLVIGPGVSRFFNQIGAFGTGFLGEGMMFLSIAGALLVGIYDIILIVMLAVRRVPEGPPGADEYDEPAYRRRRRYEEDDEFEDRPRPRSRDEYPRSEDERRRSRRDDPYYEDDPPRRRRPLDDET